MIRSNFSSGRPSRACQGFRGKIRPDPAVMVGILQQAEQDTAAAGTQIQDPAAVRQLPHGLLHQVFRILAGDQDMGRDPERQSHEFLFSQYISQGFPLLSAGDQFLIFFIFLPGYRTVRIGQQGLYGSPADMLQQTPGVDAGVRQEVQHPGPFLTDFSVSIRHICSPVTILRRYPHGVSSCGILIKSLPAASSGGIFMRSGLLPALLSARRIPCAGNPSSQKRPPRRRCPPGSYHHPVPLWSGSGTRSRALKAG